MQSKSNRFLIYDVLILLWLLLALLLLFSFDPFDYWLWNINFVRFDLFYLFFSVFFFVFSLGFFQMKKEWNCVFVHPMKLDQENQILCPIISLSLIWKKKSWDFQQFRFLWTCLYWSVVPYRDFQICSKIKIIFLLSWLNLLVIEIKNKQKKK